MLHMKKLQDHIQELAGKTIVVRCNYDIPIKDGEISDTTRIEDSFQTIRLLLEHGCKLVLIAHLGRPDGQVVPEMSLKPIQEYLEEHLGETVILQPTIEIEAIKNAPSRIVLLENVRYFPGETENDPGLAKQLASMGDAYVNEAFANCHRKHASVVGITQHLPSYAGVKLANEVEVILGARNNPQQPLVVIIGGAKIETKAPLVETFRDIAQTICVGGKIAQELSTEHKDLPNLIVADLLPDGKDVTQESANLFAAKVQEAGMVIWNGTMGVFEEEPYRLGTEIIAQAIDSTQAFTIVGGGDTEAALTVLDLEHNINHISTGGGAMLDLLSDGALVAISALDEQ